MKRLLLIILATVALGAALYWSVGSIETPLEWHGMTQGVTKAKAEQKKILVDVYTDWCTWCKKMDNEVYTDAQVKKYLQEHFILVKLNAESKVTETAGGVTVTQADLAQAFNVTGYPTIIFMTQDGTPITSLAGYHPTPEFLDIVSYIGSDAYTQKSFEDWKGKK